MRISLLSFPPLGDGRRNPRRRRAFTMIEILAASSIIAILIVLFLPALGRTFAAAKSAKCLGNLRQISTGAVLYGNDNGLYPPINTWPDLVWPYLSSTSTSFNLPKGTKTAFWCPAASLVSGAGLNHNGNMSYGINGTYYCGKNPLQLDVPKSRLYAFMDCVPHKSNVFAYSTDAIPIGRHPNGINVAFADSHVETVTTPVGTAAWDYGFYGLTPP